MTALQIIAYVKTLNPSAKLIPNSQTYNSAVREYNAAVKNSSTRPAVPDWFCGNVTSRGLLEDAAVAPGGGPISISPVAEIDSGTGADLLSEYPMDGCVLSGGTPGSPGYVNCLGGWEVDRNLGGADYWADFVVEYAAAAESGEGICVDTAANASCISNSGGVCWCYCSIGSGARETGDYKLSISGLSSDGFSCDTNTSNFNKWGGGMAIIAAFFNYGGKWRGGKFEWIRPGSTSRSFKNIKSGYCGWDCTLPSKSSACKACMISADGTKRTKMASASR
jgi:hypothetical protein